MKKNTFILFSALILIIVFTGLISFVSCKNEGSVSFITPPPFQEDEVVETAPPYSPHPNDTLVINLVQQTDTQQAQDDVYVAMPGELLKLCFSADVYAENLKCTLVPDSGAQRTVLSAVDFVSSGNYCSYISVTDSMAARNYTLYVVAVDEDGETVLNFCPMNFTVEKSVYTLDLFVDGYRFKVRAYDDVYDNNTFLCLSDISTALADTGKAVSFARPAGSINDATSRWIVINGKQKRYYSYLHFGELFAKAVDICMMADITIRENNGTFKVDTKESFYPILWDYDGAGYFDGLNGALLGVAGSGTVLYSYKEDNVVPLASTSKLMTYVVLMDAVAAGRVSMDDQVTISEEASSLSLSEDGLYYLAKGRRILLSDLVKAMLLSSSNEAAVAIACHVSGSEAEFVAEMNKKAAALGLTTAAFYNASGLDTYSGKLYSVKKQNQMSVMDMFEFVRHILSDYYEITEITSMDYCYISSLGKTVTNTNSVLFNIDSIVGLKTGYTVRSGYCMVTVKKTDGGQLVIALVYGAENTAERDRLSELLIKCIG